MIMNQLVKMTSRIDSILRGSTGITLNEICEILIKEGYDKELVNKIVPWCIL